MRPGHVVVIAAVWGACGGPRAEPSGGPRWQKHDVNAAARFEAAGVADFDGDGRLDVFSGDSWYAGPTWRRHVVREVPPSSNPHYTEDFGDLPLDVDGDGRLDIVTCSFFGARIGWVARPADPTAAWSERDVEHPGPSEACFLVDIDGDGRLDLLPNTVDRVRWYSIGPGAPPTWTSHDLGAEGVGHGVGAGDIDGDGRVDVVTATGYYLQPATRDAPWRFEAAFDLGAASIPILARDVDGDGLTDVVSGNGHGYGLFWLRQTKAPDGTRGWRRADIDAGLSQVHTMAFIDLDGAGAPAVVTGKRVYAHEVEPGATDAPGVYAYRYDRAASVWRKETIWEGAPPAGPPAAASERDAQRDFAPGTAGTGLHIVGADLDRDGDLDLVCPGKSGLYVFESLRR